MAATLLTPFQEAPVETTVIAGAVTAPPERAISRPLRVILIPPQYLDLWNIEVQRRLDYFWQEHTIAFAKRRELFFQFSRRAHKDATEYVLTRMRRDPFEDFSEYQAKTSASGVFEFRNVPLGEYKILAVGEIDGQDVVWHESLDVRSTVPYFLELKKRVP
jgi:hypothetical protein